MFRTPVSAHDTPHPLMGKEWFRVQTNTKMGDAFGKEKKMARLGINLQSPSTARGRRHSSHIPTSLVYVGQQREVACGDDPTGKRELCRVTAAHAVSLKMEAPKSRP